MLLLLLQQLDDALLAEAVGVLDAQEMRVVIVRDLVVRAGDPVRLRVVGMWKLLERNEARPVVVFGPAGRRHRPVPLTPHRHEPGELIADIAVDIRVREVQRWKRPLAQRLGTLPSCAPPLPSSLPSPGAPAPAQRSSTKASVALL